jgi:hypothetical protein
MATSRFLLRIRRQAAVLMLFLSLAAPANAQSVTMPSSLDSIVSGAQAGFVSLSTTGTTPSVSCPVATCNTPIRVTVRTSSSGLANIRLGTTTGLTAPAGYTAAQWTSGTATEIAFEGTEANVQAALATLAYRGGQGSISASISPNGVAYYSVTGNYYRYVNVAAPWLTAKNDAESAGRRLFGATGYLASVTSAGEFDFIKNKMNIPSGTQLWLGGSRCPAPYSVGCVAGAQPGGTNLWYWVGAPAPESTEPFYNGSRDRLNGGVTPAGKYSPWADGEPNGVGGEGYVQVLSGATPEWNDLDGSSSLQYVIEYTGSGLATNASTSVSGPVLVPVLPTAMLGLFASLMAGVGLFFQRKRRSRS